MYILTICLTLIVGSLIGGCSRKKIITSGYVDLGLPSGTEWNATNETYPRNTIDENNALLFYDDALGYFGDNLPTKEQFEELRNNCEWEWDDSKKGYVITGINDNSIFMPTVGWWDNFYYNESGWGGLYWTSTPNDTDNDAWALMFDPHSVTIDHCGKLCQLPVRLVRNKN